MRALLDTHVLLWWHIKPSRLSQGQQAVIDAANTKVQLLVSDISLWEVAMLHNLGRIRLTIPLRKWLEMAVAPPLVNRLGTSPAVATGLASLPESFHHDPADRILVATAKVTGATLLTRDHRIVKSGLVDTLT